MIEPASLGARLDDVLSEATIPELPNPYRGKVRDNYDLPDGRRIIIATDRLSAFDRIIAAIPLKGQVLTQIARFWFDRTRDICPNHVLEYPDPNVVVCRRLAIMPVEIVVRDYLAGTTATSIGTMYKAGKREVYGLRLPEGLRENQKLPETILTPTTKAAQGGHDEPLSPAEIVARGLLSEAHWRTVAELSLALFARGRETARERGLILADTKYEFGFDGAGGIVLADEIHTPDSSRYWRADSYERRLAAGEPPESLDKDVLRSWVRARCDPYRDPLPPIPREIILETARIYIDAFETITGERFVMPPATPVLTRIRVNLARFF
ncbi:MAG TPA: phosphoribosylaminoimidazolesuccinocarboxamide synthase [Stellaceae bacterium]|nr:phosphoribosylaminoimidazolesuccinocarboxamide synthase [Stellaceae bacterium]